MAATPAQQTVADFLLNFPRLPPGRAPASCFHQQGAQRELQRLHYLGKKLMVAATAVLFLSGNLQGHFKVKGNLRLQQVPRQPPGWVLPPGRVGLAGALCRRGPANFSI